MKLKTFIVDAFTNEIFKGNSAGVCLLENDLEDNSMLSIAKELGLSETAYVKKIEGNKYSIKYFSPKKEIPLCGHATLAAAKILFERTSAIDIHFITGENLSLIIKRYYDQIVMEFPVYNTTTIMKPLAVLRALGLEHVVNTSYSPINKIIVLEIVDAGMLAALKPDFTALLNSYDGINGVLVTAPSANKDYDYYYRYFWPWAGTNEDPVTGGVQTFLAKYWSDRLNKKVMKAFQSSARTGQMTVELQNDKVLISGQAVITFEGVLLGID